MSVALSQPFFRVFFRRRYASLFLTLIFRLKFSCGALRTRIESRVPRPRKKLEELPRGRRRRRDGRNHLVCCFFSTARRSAPSFIVQICRLFLLSTLLLGEPCAFRDASQRESLDVSSIPPRDLEQKRPIECSSAGPLLCRRRRRCRAARHRFALLADSARFFFLNSPLLLPPQPKNTKTEKPRSYHDPPRHLPVRPGPPGLGLAPRGARLRRVGGGGLF